MPTLHHADRSTSVRLRAEHFTDLDVLDIASAGSVLAAAIADIAHHQISEPGYWDCYGDPSDELARLQDALDGMQQAIRDARSQLSSVERRARRRATRGSGRKRPISDGA